MVHYRIKLVGGIHKPLSMVTQCQRFGQSTLATPSFLRDDQILPQIARNQ